MTAKEKVKRAFYEQKAGLASSAPDLLEVQHEVQLEGVPEEYLEQQERAARKAANATTATTTATTATPVKHVPNLSAFKSMDKLLKKPQQQVQQTGKKQKYVFTENGKR